MRACDKYQVPPPPASALSRAQVANLIADLKRSETRKSVCLRRLIAFYDAQAKTLAGK